MSRQRGVVLGRALVGDVVDLGLRAVDDVVDLALAGVADLHDLGAGLDQPAQDRLLADDLGVVAGVGGDRARWRRACGGTAPRRPGPARRAVQLGGDRDRVGRLAAAVEVEDRVVDRARGPAGRSRRRGPSRRRRRSRPCDSSMAPSTRLLGRACPAAGSGRPGLVEGALPGAYDAGPSPHSSSGGGTSASAHATPPRSSNWSSSRAVHGQARRHGPTRRPRVPLAEPCERLDPRTYAPPSVIA